MHLIELKLSASAKSQLSSLCFLLKQSEENERLAREEAEREQRRIAEDWNCLCACYHPGALAYSGWRVAMNGNGAKPMPGSKQQF